METRPRVKGDDIDTDLLKEEDYSPNHFVPLLLQAEECAWRADEHLGLAVGHVVLEAAALHQPLHCLFVRREVVIGPRELRDHLVPEGVEWRPRGKESNISGHQNTLARSQTRVVLIAQWSEHGVYNAIYWFNSCMGHKHSIQCVKCMSLWTKASAK